MLAVCHSVLCIRYHVIAIVIVIRAESVFLSECGMMMCS